MTKTSRVQRPPIHILDTEGDRISELACRFESTSPNSSEQLLSEIDRAKIHTRKSLPKDVVTMMSQVDFVDESTGKSRSVTLVWPTDANMDEGRLSILSLVGAGLIGMREGASIDWPDRLGNSHRLRIVRVVQPDIPAVAG